MSIETRLELTRLAVQLAIELMRNKSGHLGFLRLKAGLSKHDGPLAVIDAIRDHLEKPFSEQESISSDAS